MRVVIAGSRVGMTYQDVTDAIRLSTFDITEVVSGGANGVDNFGELWASRHNVPVKRFIPDWSTYGKSAGPFRNRAMAMYADAVIVVWDGQSKGSKSMIAEAKKANRPLYIYIRSI